MNLEYNWRTGRTCIFKAFYHVVFVTKYRRNVFSKEMLESMYLVFKETCLQMDVELLEFNGEDDHVHLMLSCHPKLALSNLVGKLKGKSSYMLRKEFWPQIKQKLWGKHLWSPSYCLVSCGGAPLNIVKQYIQQQRTPPSQRSIRQSIQESKGRFVNC
ncbi:MAG: IS200/IS605 family transposase [Gammaproteobacteria bacterium]